MPFHYAPLSRGRRPSRGAFVFYVHFCLLYILNILTLQQQKKLEATFGRMDCYYILYLKYKLLYV